MDVGTSFVSGTDKRVKIETSSLHSYAMRLKGFNFMPCLVIARDVSSK